MTSWCLRAVCLDEVMHSSALLVATEAPFLRSKAQGERPEVGTKGAKRTRQFLGQWCKDLRQKNGPCPCFLRTDRYVRGKVKEAPLLSVKQPLRV